MSSALAGELLHRVAHGRQGGASKESCQELLQPVVHSSGDHPSGHSPPQVQEDAASQDSSAPTAAAGSRRRSVAGGPEVTKQPRP